MDNGKTDIITGLRVIKENMKALDGLRHQYYKELMHIKKHQVMLEEREEKLNSLLKMIKREYNDFLEKMQPFEL